MTIDLSRARVEIDATLDDGGRYTGIVDGQGNSVSSTLPAGADPNDPASWTTEVTFGEWQSARKFDGVDDARSGIECL